jgi:hypothetical protein
VKLECAPRLSADADFAPGDAGGQHLIEHLDDVMVDKRFKHRPTNERATGRGEVALGDGIGLADDAPVVDAYQAYVGEVRDLEGKVFVCHQTVLASALNT